MRGRDGNVFSFLSSHNDLSTRCGLQIAVNTTAKPFTLGMCRDVSKPTLLTGRQHPLLIPRPFGIRLCPIIAVASSSADIEEVQLPTSASRCGAQVTSLTLHTFIATY